LPQHAVIISSSPVTNTCTTNGPNPNPVLKQEADGKMISLKLIHSSAANRTSIIGGNSNAQAAVTSPDVKRLVIRLSKQGEAWKPVDQVMTSDIKSVTQVNNGLEQLPTSKCQVNAVVSQCASSCQPMNITHSNSNFNLDTLNLTIKF